MKEVECNLYDGMMTWVSVCKYTVRFCISQGSENQSCYQNTCNWSWRLKINSSFEKYIIFPEQNLSIIPTPVQL
jgi:hypothetical protein